MYIPELKEVLGSIYNQLLDLPITFDPPIRKSPLWSPPSKFRYPDTVALPLISSDVLVNVPPTQLPDPSMAFEPST